MSRTSTVVMLVRHRWIAIPERRSWVCHPLASSLYEATDPHCFGCRSAIAFKEFPNPDRYRRPRRDVERDFVFAQLEAFGLRLDLLHEELKAKAA